MKHKTVQVPLCLLDGTIGCGVPLPQNTPIDLAGSALREVFKEDNLLGYLIGGQALCDKSNQFLRGDSLTRLTTHKSNDTLAQIGSIAPTTPASRTTPCW